MSNFVYWKLPEIPEIYTIKDPIEINLASFSNNQEGFVLFPFTREKGGKLFQGQIETIDNHKLVLPTFTSESLIKTNSNQKYRELVQNALNQIALGTFKKVVLAQTTNQQLAIDFNLNVFFDNLCKSYPHAFVYCVGFGNEVWIGASPEIFLKKTQNNYQTYALAGTRQTNSAKPFGAKEQKEQAFVRDYIVEKITALNAKSIDVSELHEINTGNLWHLINEISFEHQNPLEIIENLHPTPAICGFPLDKSLAFINEFESFDREYYAGFLGPISKSGDFSLWVNLRCAKIQSSMINFYAGAGIVEGSDPEAEYLETERKMDTLRQLV